AHGTAGAHGPKRATRGMVAAGARAAPLLERPDRHLPDQAEPAARQEDIVDVVGRAILPAVPPIVGRRGLATLQLPPELMIGADQAMHAQSVDGGGVVHQPTGAVPDDVVVEIARDDGGPLRGKVRIAAAGPAPRAPPGPGAG